MTQFSLFGAEAAVPALADLDGVVVGGGQWVRGPGGARLSVLVADRWRADALVAAFAALGLVDAEPVVGARSGFGARTAFTRELDEAAARWVTGARLGVPPGFVLGAGGLRMWAITAGVPDTDGYRLATGPDERLHRVAGAQLSALGVAAVALASQRGRHGAGWRVTSRRRLRRLAELLGAAPPGAGADWPAPHS